MVCAKVGSEVRAVGVCHEGSLRDMQEMGDILGLSQTGLPNATAYHELSWFLQFRGLHAI